MFSNARERPKAGGLLGKQRAILCGVAFIGRSLLEDLCKSPVLVCRQKHWNHPPPHNGTTSVLAIKSALGSIPNILSRHPKEAVLI